MVWLLVMFSLEMVKLKTYLSRRNSNKMIDIIDPESIIFKAKGCLWPGQFKPLILGLDLVDYGLGQQTYSMHGQNLISVYLDPIYKNGSK